MAIAAASRAARSVLRSAPVRSAASRFASGAKPTASPFSSTSRIALSSRLSRYPVELSACLETLQPYHTATASALMTSLLTASQCGCAWLPDVCNDDV